MADRALFVPVQRYFRLIAISHIYVTFIASVAGPGVGCRLYLPAQAAASAAIRLCLDAANTAARSHLLPPVLSPVGHRW